jgi:hypothetical protein
MYTQLGPTGPTGPMPTDYVSSFNGKTGAVQGVSSINGNTGAISNVAFTNTAQSFTGLQQFTQGISASGGITFNSDVNINVDNSLVVATITNTAGGKSQLDIDNRASSRVAIGDYDGGGNSTYIFLRDNVSNLQISNPYGAIAIGDPNAIDAGNYISYTSPDATLYGNNSNIDGFANIFVSYVSASQGISASGGVTFYFPSSGNTSIRFVSTAARYIEITPGLQNSMVGYGSGGFKFKANAGQLSLASVNVTAIGDVDGDNQQTVLYVDDDSGIISFSFVGGQYTFPNTDGSANYVMKTDGAGALEWSPFVRTVNGYSGGVTFLAGSNITLTPSAAGITIAATSGGGGGISRSINSISTDTSAGSAASTDYVYICTAGLSLTLPTAASNTNRYSVKNNTASVVRIYTTSSQTIDGITFFNLNKQYQALDLMSDGSNWSIF